MLGTTFFTYHHEEDGRSFLELDFKMFPKANRLRVTLDPDDTYTVWFYRVRGLKVEGFCKESGIYAEDLAPLFRRVTGLETRPPRFAR